MRLLAVILSYVLAVSPAWAACTGPALDAPSLAQTASDGGSPLQISTSGPNELILYYPAIMGDTVVTPPISPLPPVVTNVIDGAGLTWHERGTATIYQQIPAVCGGGRCAINEQLWWAYSTAQLTNDTITPTYSFPPNFWVFQNAFGVTNVANPAQPFDTNGSLPAANSAPSGGSTYNLSLTTTQSLDLVIISCGTLALTSPLCDVLQSQRPPWTLFASWGVSNLGGISFYTLTTQPNLAPGTITISSTEPNWLARGDAIAGCGGGSGASGGGTFLHGWPW